MKQVKVGRTPLVVDVPEAGDAEPLAREDGRPRRYAVKLHMAGRDIVEAESPEAAYEMFKAAHGILASDHAPEIVGVTDDEAKETEAAR